MRCLVALFVLANFGLSAQTDPFWAITNSSTIVEIHRTSDSASAVVARVTRDNVLLVRCEEGPWCWAQDQIGNQGYVRHAEVVALTALDDSSAITWMMTVFARERQLGEGINWYDLNYNTTKQQAYGDSLNNHDLIYVAALSLFETSYCRLPNDTLLLELMHAVAANPGSASEEPPAKLAKALQCHPDEFKKVVKMLEPSKQELVLAATTNGLWLSFDQHDPTSVAERDRLILLLDGL